MKKRTLSLLLLLLLSVLVSGCGQKKKEVYQQIYLDVFDTVTTIRGYDVSQEAFNRTAEQAHEALLEYHRLFDIYTPCSDGVQAVNAAAGQAPVVVDSRVMELLTDCKEFYTLTGGRVNIAMGSVLSLWHEARTAGLADPEHAYLPDADALLAASEHTDMDGLILDTEAGTAYLSDPELRLDVGAIAKGWTAEKVAQLLPEGYMLNLGGNVRTRGTKADGSDWVIGIQSPSNAAEYIGTVGIAEQSLVTSGDYQRSYTVDGVAYHHIIDPDTRMPSQYWRSVSILCKDSGLADCLSTALFLMPLEEGKALVHSCGAEAAWIDDAGNIYQTDGFRFRQ